LGRVSLLHKEISQVLKFELKLVIWLLSCLVMTVRKNGALLVVSTVTKLNFMG